MLGRQTFAFNYDNNFCRPGTRYDNKFLSLPLLKAAGRQLNEIWVFALLDVSAWFRLDRRKKRVGTVDGEAKKGRCPNENDETRKKLEEVEVVVPMDWFIDLLFRRSSFPRPSHHSSANDDVRPVPHSPHTNHLVPPIIFQTRICNIFCPTLYP